jgi:TATA-box binding protein (TBP) (component of TFIID and TFIIIB)
MDEQFSAVMSVWENELFSVPKISTATIVCTLTLKKITLAQVALNKDLSVRTKKGKNYRPFNNSLTLVFDGTKTVKVFSNGKLHITGCTTVRYAEELASRFITSMSWDDVGIDNTKILTLNTTVKLEPKKVLSLQDMFHILNKEKNKNYNVRYTPDIYQGLVLKAECTETKRLISILTFYTGSFIVCGVRSPEELRFGLSFLYNLMKDNLHLFTL